jgi:hypothetical protein
MSDSDHALPLLLACAMSRVAAVGARACAWGGFLRAARGLAEGRFEGFADNSAHAELNDLFTP